MPDSVRILIRAVVSLIAGCFSYLVILIRIRRAFPGPDGSGGPFRDGQTNAVVYRLLRHVISPLGTQGYLAYCNSLLMAALFFVFLTWLRARRQRREALSHL